MLGRFSAAWTMDSMVREVTGTLFQQLGNCAGFQSEVGVSDLKANQGIRAETHTSCPYMLLET